MNKWNQLVVSLDHVFGMNNKERSTFKKLSQDYDERTNELVIVIEYRVRVYLDFSLAQSSPLYWLLFRKGFGFATCHFHPQLELTNQGQHDQAPVVVVLDPYL